MGRIQDVNQLADAGYYLEVALAQAAEITKSRLGKADQKRLESVMALIQRARKDAGAVAERIDADVDARLGDLRGRVQH